MRDAISVANAESLHLSCAVLSEMLLLSEQKVALQGHSPHVLTMAAETLAALLFPLYPHRRLEPTTSSCKRADARPVFEPTTRRCKR